MYMGCLPGMHPKLACFHYMEWVFFYLQPDAMNMIPAQMQIPGLDMSANLHNSATEVLCLMNMVEVEELMDDEEYEGNNCD